VSELFLEVRCEDLPARFVQPGITGLEAAVRGLLAGVSHGAVRTWATPRRLAVAVSGVAAARPVEEKLLLGPAVAAAYKDGAPTAIAEGFARGKGVPVESLEQVDGPKGKVIAARVRTGGESTLAQLTAGLEAAILAIPFPKVMRWGAGAVAWARPIHGLVVLWDGAVVPCSLAGVPAGDTTLGHRLAPGPVPVGGAATYDDALRGAFVLADREARRAAIVASLRAAAAAHAASVEPVLDLVDEVVDLVEWPAVIEARFDDDLLHLPPRLLVEAMKVHQRVFPLFAAGGDLLSTFLVVTNHPYAAEPATAATIAEGNARVLRARFYDARFFYAEDRKQRLEAHGARLGGMQWIRGGGTMADKAARIGDLAARLAPHFGASPALAARAGALSKSDLCTTMVGEFPELQGHVGRLLAGFDGEDPAVATALEESYLPRFAGDAPPVTPVGRAVAAADRLDTLAGCFRLGLKPKSSADPLGLRRAAAGLLAILAAAGWRGSLGALLAEATGADAALTADLREFVLARHRAALADSLPGDVIDAVFSAGDDDTLAIAARAQALAAAAQAAGFDAVKSTFKRLANITREHPGRDFDRTLLASDAHDAALLAAYDGWHVAFAQALASDGPAAALGQIAGLQPVLARYFDAVMVNCDDAGLRASRLGLLKSFATAMAAFADFKALS
jgi:glycyl-tRNA synthetase beta chain